MGPPVMGRPVAGDAVVAVAAVVIQTGARMLAPLARPVTDRWPGPLRALAEAGFARRQEATAQALGWYHQAAPAIVRDVLDQLDLPGLVRDVLEQSDLPELVRLSTTSVATETVRDLRLRTMAGDETVSGWVGRALSRRRATVPAAVAPVAD